jgi:lysophospholipase L1-like esterase
MKSRRALPLLLVAVLAASIGLNVVLFAQGDKYFHEINALRLDPLGSTIYPVAPPGSCAPSGPPGAAVAAVAASPAPGSAHRVLFFGDSRALMWSPPAGMQGVEFVNRGIGNQTTAQILERLDRHVRPVMPQVVVLQAGVNDLKMIPLFPERREAIVRDCTKNLEEITTRLRALGATVVVTTIFPLGKVPLARRPFWSGDVARSIEEVNASLRALASRTEHVVLFDAYPLLVDTGNGPRDQVTPAYSADLLHLSPNGYEALNPKLVSVLTPLALAP